MAIVHIVLFKVHPIDPDLNRITANGLTLSSNQQPVQLLF